MKKKLFTLFLAMMACLGSLFAESGTCGENLTWDLTDGVLTISGTGAMTDYLDLSSNRAPWYSSRSSITSVIISDGVTSIGDYAFLRCTGLTSVTIPNSVTSIGDYAFSSSIGVNSFLGCSALTSVTIGNSVTNIGNNAFGGCVELAAVNISDIAAWCNISFGDVFANPLYYARKLYHNGTLVTDLIIPNSVSSIVNCAFSLYESLTSITIPNSVTSIGDGAFSGCSGLTSVTIPNSVTSIGEGAFWGCSGLTSVTIGNSVTSIGNWAFYGCSSLKYVTMESTTPPLVGNNTFDNTTPIYVPLGAWNAYQEDDNWKNYNLRLFDATVKTSTVRPTSATIMFSSPLNGKYIAACGIEEGEEFSGNTAEYIGLEPESEYADVPFYIRTTKGDILTMPLTFTTTALELTTKPSKAVSSTTAILFAETNMSDAEVNCGFEYKRNDAPVDMEGTKVFCPVASGQMAGRLKGLKDDVYYKYRAFYQSAAGNMFYGDWQYIFTGDVAVEFDPILYIYGATVVRENEATISGYALAGSEDFTEQGFEYWAESRTNSGANAPHRVPAALNEHFFVQASGIALRATLTNLDAGTVYKYRVYGKVGDQYYYGAEQAFTTTGTYTPPTYTVTFANWDGAVLQSSQVEDGKIPVYSGETPVRPEDEQYTYTFSGWTPQIVAATTDATYTAQYVAKDKHEGLEDIQEDHIPCTKVIRNGQIFILRGEKEYTLTGQEIK